MEISELKVSTFNRVDQPGSFKETSLEEVFFKIKLVPTFGGVKKLS